MPGRKQIGEISAKDAHEVEWTIKDIFSYTEKDKSYISPCFTVSGTEWCLKISPNGQSRSHSEGWISLYLYRRFNTGPKQGARYSLGLKKADGSIKEIIVDYCWLFDTDGSGLGSPKCLLKSELLDQKSELAPSDNLTVKCCLWIKEEDSLSSLSCNLTGLLNSKKYCDLTVKVKNEVFSAHKCILAARSSVFAGMFDSDAEKKVLVADCEPEVFNDFLSYLYSGRFEKLRSSPFELYAMANKFNVKDLMAESVISIMSHLTAENFCEAAVLAENFNLDPLKIKCEDSFIENFTEIVLTPEWETLLKRDSALALAFIKHKASEEARQK